MYRKTYVEVNKKNIIDNIKTVYNEDRTVVKLSFNMIPMQPSVTFSGKMNCYAPYSNFGTVDELVWNHVVNTDGSYTFSTDIKLIDLLVYTLPKPPNGRPQRWQERPVPPELPLLSCEV